MSGANGHSPISIELLDGRYQSIPAPPPPPSLSKKRRGAIIAAVLFALTIFSTLAVGAHFAAAYAADQAPFSDDFNPFAPVTNAIAHPAILLLGIPFSFTLLGILLAHELGHFFACRIYGIDASYPYFIPAPTIIGTMGAFIRIRSPIINRKALFDVGLSGPVVGFIFAVPALALAIAYSKVVPAAQWNAQVIFGNPPLVRILMAWLRPGVLPESLLLHPVGRAAWVGLFATALNLLPAGQLDGGHLVYSVAPGKHRLISFGLVLALLPLGHLWGGWYAWAVLLFFLGFRHPPLLDSWEPLDRNRRVWAAIAVVIFLLCFTPIPFATR
jgi:membrane-associated protease RseP (regulator of RpoE activity)